MAITRPRDTIRVQIIGSTTIPGGDLDNFTSLMIRNDITMPSEASFEIGDDGTWHTLGNIFEPGVEFQIFINDTPRLRGRVEMNDVPLDTSAGAVVRFTVRTKLSDAMYASADQGIRVQGSSIEDFILAVYAPLGYTKADFEFDQLTSRQLITGERTSLGAKAQAKVSRKSLKKAIKEARVKPPESIYAAADRHLRRNGLMHWDGPTGKIIVGIPDDEADPLYVFNMFRNSAQSSSNNILGATRTRDWSGIPSSVNVYGKGGKKGFTKSNVGATANDFDVTTANFYRPLHILAEGIRTNDLALSAAKRELSARSKRKDSFTIDVDGLSFWDGQKISMYAPDTVATINTDVAGGDAGAYYIHATTLTRDASGGDTCQLDLLKRGIWSL